MIRKIFLTPYLPAYVLAIGLCISWVFAYTPLLVIVVYTAMTLLTFVMYWKDKRAAVNDTWRTPENTLHILALCGGWPGAIWAQQTLRHKTQKRSFRIVFWMTAVLNVIAVASLHLPAINMWLRGSFIATIPYLGYAA